MNGETKHERFLRLAEKRVPRAMEDLRLVGQLASANYKYSPEEAEEIVEALREAVSGVAYEFGIPNKETQAVIEACSDGKEPVEDNMDYRVDPKPEEDEVVIPPPIRFTGDELEYSGPVDADKVREALQAMTYNKDLEETVRILREALSE